MSTSLFPCFIQDKVMFLHLRYLQDLNLHHSSRMKYTIRSKRLWITKYFTNLVKILVIIALIICVCVNVDRGKSPSGSSVAERPSSGNPFIRTGSLKAWKEDQERIREEEEEKERQKNEKRARSASKKVKSCHISVRVSYDSAVKQCSWYFSVWCSLFCIFCVAKTFTIYINNIRSFLISRRSNTLC